MQIHFKIFASQRLPFKGQAFTVLAFITAIGLLFPNFVFAQFNWFFNVIAGLLLGLAELIGHLAIMIIGLLVDIAQFNNFIDAPAVVKGWKIVRDVCNMFFIVILLLISFGSVFRIEEYQYKRILGKLLIMAVLINFSKMISGFFIDIAQVVMLTFVNGFKEAASGNFINGFGIREMFTFSTTGDASGDPNQGLSGTKYLGAAALALATITITCVVVGIYLIVFLLRIIALWFLVIISPIAYALAAFPGDAKKYSSTWWDYFGKYASTGPILAFFLWLSLSVMQTSSTLGSDFSPRESETGLSAIPNVGITQIGESNVLLSFIINIMLLMGGLWITQQLGVAGGKLAAAASNKIQNAGMAIAKSPLTMAKGLAKTGYAQRIGYGAGIALATGAAKLPVVGGMAARMEGKLRRSRAKKMSRYAQDLAYTSEETQMARAIKFQKKTEQHKKGFRKLRNLIPMGEKSRARGLYITQLAAKSQDKLPKEAREKRVQAELLSSQARDIRKENEIIKQNTKVKDENGKEYSLSELEQQETNSKRNREQAEAELKSFQTEGKEELANNLKELSKTIAELERAIENPKVTPDEKERLVLERIKKQNEKVGLEKDYNDTEKSLANKVALAKFDESKFTSLLQEAKSKLPPDFANRENKAASLENDAHKLNVEAKNIQQRFWGSIMDTVAYQAKHKVTVDNNDVYEDKDLGDFRENFLMFNPNLIPEDQPRLVTDPNTPEVVGKAIKDKNGNYVKDDKGNVKIEGRDILETTEVQYRQQRTGIRALEDLSLSALSDTNSVMGQLADNLDRLNNSLKVQGLSINARGNIINDKGQILTDEKQQFQIFKTAFLGMDSFRATQSPRKVSMVDQALIELIELMKKKASGGFISAEEEKILDRATKFNRTLVYAALNPLFQIAATRSRYS